MKKKYIAIISKADETGGGASRIAAGLVKLINGGEEYEAHHWVGLAGPNASWYTHKLHGGRWLSLIQGAFSVSSRAIGFPDFFTPELLIHFAKKSFDYSLYHFHDISYTFSPFALNWLARRVPVVWTLHDCSPFTGGCIAPLECQSFRTGCRKCPQLSSLPLGTRFDFTGVMQAYKAKMLSKNQISLICPSQWLIDTARSASGFLVNPKHIPNFVDTRAFRSIDKAAVRSVLGLPSDRFIVLLCATGLADTHKGFAYAVQSLRNVNKRVFIIGLGKIERSTEAGLAGFASRLPGYIYNEELLAQYFAAADVLLFPTLADSFGLVAIEAMASGTPPIAFRTGGVPEIVEHDINGWLASPKDSMGLAQGLALAMEEPARLMRWAQNGLAKVKQEYGAERFLRSHLEIYRCTSGAK